MPKGENWSVADEPAANTKATVSKAAETTGYHVITGIQGSIGGGSASSHVSLRLKQGSTVLFSEGLINAAGAVSKVELLGLNIKLDVNTTATAEFDAAGGSGTTERVSMQGYTEYRP